MNPRKPPILKDDAEMSVTDIALKLGVSVAYVSQTIARAKKRLKNNERYKRVAEEYRAGKELREKKDGG